MILALALLVPAALAAQTAPSVTLFNNGRILVRRTLPLAVPAGPSTQRFALGAFEPASLALLDPGMQLLRVSYDGAWSEDALLRRNIGKTFLIRRDGGPMNATLVGMDPERWRIGSDREGGVLFGRPGQIVWPDALLPAAPFADVALQAERAAQNLRILYQTVGGSWRASYRIFLGAQARVEGNAAVSGGRLELDGAEVQLLAGDIGAPPPMAAGAPMMARAVNAMETKAYMDGVPSQEAVGESRLYTLPGKVSFAPGQQLVVPLFAPVSARAERRLVVRGSVPFWGGMGPEGSEANEVPVEVSYRLDRKAGTPFGDLPLPMGDVAIFDADRAGRVQLIGQGTLPQTAPAEELTIRTGTAFDVTARRTQTAFTTTRGGTAQAPRTIATVAYGIELQNAKDSAVTVEVLEERGGEWSVLESSVPAQKRSSSRTAFVVTVPAKGKATLTYRLRVVW